MTRSTALRSDRRPLRHRSRRVRSDLAPVLRFFLASRPRLLLMGAALAMVTVLMGMGLLGLSGWFITATGLAGLQASSAIAFDVFQPSAGIRLLALGRTGARYAERLVTHDATLAVLAARLGRVVELPAAAGTGTGTGTGTGIGIGIGDKA